jgi:hypothetical protein
LRHDPRHAEEAQQVQHNVALDTFASQHLVDDRVARA